MDAINPVEKAYETFEKTDKKRKRYMYCSSVLVPLFLMALQLLISIEFAPEKEDDRHDLAKYKYAYLIPSLTNFASFSVLAFSFCKIWNFLKDNQWTRNNKCMILHMVLFLLFTAVLEIIFLLYLMVNDSYSKLPAFDVFFMLD